MCEDTFTEDFEHLLTHASNINEENDEYFNTPSKSKQTPKSNQGRYSHFLKCQEHDKGKNQWDTFVNGKCEHCMVFTKLNSLPPGKLPTKYEVLCYLLTQGEESKSKGQSSGWQDFASTLALHWIFCNVYPKSLPSIRKKLKECKDEYYSLKKYNKSKRGKTYYLKLNTFVQSCKMLFDIIGDYHQIKRQEDTWNVLMTEEGHIFYQKQTLCPREGYCTSFVCRKSEIRDMRRSKNKERQKKYQEQIREQQEESIKPTLIPDCDEACLNSGSDSDPDFHLEPPEKKTKYEFQPTLPDKNDDLPHRYRHIRNGLRSVRHEVYEAAQVLNAEYHMSRSQIEGAFIEVGKLFDRKWKPYKPNAIIDNDALPSMTNIVRTRDFAEAMALNSIVEEVMNSSEGSSVTYSNDGSAMNKVGSYVVQSITVNGVQRALPALTITTESHETLKDLELTTLRILSASTGYKYSEADIIEKITFVMTDSTAHNIGVIEKVCNELEVEESNCPKTLLCNIHPLMMFQTKLKELYNDIQQSFGSKKLDECFTVDVDFKNENFVLKAIKCLTNLVNEDNRAKPWNRFSHFSQFIAPKQNETISFKDHRFNRLNDCCLVALHHFDDIGEYLMKFKNITNNMAILDRSFIDLGDILKPIFCATAILGYHITRPFHRLLLDLNTTYDTLLVAFPKLYDELTNTNAESLLTTDQVFNFVHSDIFKDASYKEHLLTGLFRNADEYRNEVLKIIRLCLEKFRKGFEKQKGSIFGFGSNANEDTGSILKLSSLSDKSILKNTPVHNLGEERNVGMLNYELNLRGRKEFKTCSQNMVLNRSTDIIRNEFKDLRKFKLPAKEIKELKLQWTNKMAEIEKEGLQLKEASSLAQEKKKLQDLEFLKTQSPVGPFTSAEEVEKYMKSEVDEEQRNKRLYTEMRYAKH